MFWAGNYLELRPVITAHMLRYAAGYALAARGIDTRTLQAFMGHRSIAITVVYIAIADNRDGVHPNDTTGSVKMATKWDEALEPLF